MQVQFRPASDGGWFTFVSGTRVLAVASPVEDSFLIAGWAAIREPSGFQGLLDLLTSKGLGATPAFALIEWEAERATRIIVRGDTTLEVTNATGKHQLSAASVSTWVERSMPDVTRITLAVPNSSIASTAPLPLESGVALVAEFSIATQSPTPSMSSPAAPVAVPAPAPRIDSTTSVGPDVGVEALVRDEQAEPQTPIGAPEGYDYLFGETVHRAVGEAAVHASADASSDEARAGDHDGHTVLTTDIAKTRGKRRPEGVTHPAQHGPRFVLVLSTTGAREPLTQPILVGRSPSVSKISGGKVPRLLTIGSVDQDLSRNHAQFSVEGGTVVITDLHSKNGTSIVLPGKDAQKLRAGEPTSVIVGTVVDLGSGLTLTVEEEDNGPSGGEDR